MKKDLIKKIVIAILSTLLGAFGGASLCVAVCAFMPV